ncbi:hypothetical protein LC087_18255 [Bacillus carboniphilus]|uniref:Uncharacterized protein n=1 Tax=Bacillus carboniphilus TaxID=86663 RepID=A0ABY9JTD1_9BACI|nr:hypothetical protein [Bacillus carboniphilus]WLR42597.1 hypothetical protein LC087_18255 [Bacillus carboniphilus]
MIDAIRSDDLETLNKIVVNNGKDPISNVTFDRIQSSYISFQEDLQKSIGNIDSTYGLEGTAAPWVNSIKGEILMEGGAVQIVTPLNAEILEMIGVIPKY